MLQRFKLRLGDGTVLMVDHDGLSTWLVDGRAMVQGEQSKQWQPLKEFLAEERIVERYAVRKQAKAIAGLRRPTPPVESERAEVAATPAPPVEIPASLPSDPPVATLAEALAVEPPVPASLPEEPAILAAAEPAPLQTPAAEEVRPPQPPTQAAELDWPDDRLLRESLESSAIGAAESLLALADDPASSAVEPESAEPPAYEELSIIALKPLDDEPEPAEPSPPAAMSRPPEPDHLDSFLEDAGYLRKAPRGIGLEGISLEGPL